MAILPSRIQDLLDFFDQHITPWNTNAVAIGLTAAQTAAFRTLANTARADYSAQLAAAEASRVATVQSHHSTAAARSSAADLIKLIKAFAENSANPTAVYNLAQIPPPAVQSPAQPPGTPEQIKATLGTDGSITLKWKAANPSGASGTVWSVRRKLPTNTAPVFIGASGTRSFIDETIPAGVSTVIYTIQGQRAGSIGDPSSPFTVQFGGAGPGLTITAQFSGETNTPAKLAA